MKKPLTIAAILLILTVPAFAASKKDMKDIRDWEGLNGQCVYGKPLDHPVTIKACAAADKLKKKLTARGYCTYGHGVVGRSSKDGKHCYRIGD